MLPSRPIVLALALLLTAPLLVGLVGAEPIGGEACTPTNPQACVEATCETDLGVSSCQGCVTASGGGTCSQFDNVEPPAGLGNLDAWLDANGDRMYGALDMGDFAVIFNGSALTSPDGEVLLFNSQPVCVENSTSCAVALEAGSILDEHLSAGANIAWSKISKTSSSLGDLDVRSASDLTSGTLDVARLPTSVALLDPATGRLSTERLPTRAALLDTVTGKLQVSDLPGTVAQLENGRLPIERLPTRAALLDGATGDLPLANIPDGVALLDPATQRLPTDKLPTRVVLVDANGKIALAAIPDGVALLDANGRIALGALPERASVLDANGKIPATVLPSGVVMLEASGRISASVLPATIPALDLTQTWTAVQSFGSNAVLDASTITTGTINAARLPQVVDAAVAPLAGISWSKISKSGSSLADLGVRSAGDLTSGTLSDGRLSSNVGLLDRANVWTGMQTFGLNASIDASTITSGTFPIERIPAVVDASVAPGAGIAWTKISKTGSRISDLDIRSASDLDAGTLADARLSTNVGLVDRANVWTGMQTFGLNASIDASTITSGTFPIERIPAVVDASVADGAGIAWSKISKTGSSLSDLDVRSASDLTTGTLADERLAANVGRLDRAGVWTAVQTFSTNAILDASTITTGTLSADRLPTIPESKLPMIPESKIPDGIAWTKLSKAGSSLADLSIRNASDLTSGVLASARLPPIVDSMIAAAAHIAWSKIDKTGSSLADLQTRDAAALEGTLPDARLSSNVALTGRSASWTGLQNFGANASLDASTLVSGTIDPARLHESVGRTDAEQQWTAAQVFDDLVVAGDVSQTPVAGRVLYDATERGLYVGVSAAPGVDVWRRVADVSDASLPPVHASQFAIGADQELLVASYVDSMGGGYEWREVSTIAGSTTAVPRSAGQLALDDVGQLMVAVPNTGCCQPYEWRAVSTMETSIEDQPLVAGQLAYVTGSGSKGLYVARQGPSWNPALEWAAVSTMSFDLDVPPARLGDLLLDDDSRDIYIATSTSWGGLEWTTLQRLADPSSVIDYELCCSTSGTQRIYLAELLSNYGVSCTPQFRGDLWVSQKTNEWFDISWVTTAPGYHAVDCMVYRL